MAAAISAVFLFLFFFPSLISASSTKNYIVRMDPELRPLSFATHDDWYASTLPSSADTLLYSYSAVFHGFAASLDSQQAELLRSSGSVIDVYEDPVYSLHTTRSPKFLGLDGKFGIGSGRLTKAFDEASKNVIIGVLDTGVWPESKSFNDAGMPAIPRRWKGKCERAIDFDPKLCNRKLIGARSFSRGASLRNPSDLSSPRDYDGHGTHTATTAAGSHVANASLYGYAAGVARGMASHSRLAAYKVCWSSGCFGSDILAAIETAVVDGVDVLSLSLGGGSAPYYIDPVAVGALAAVQRGIFVSCSAGNAGPTRSTVTNVAPWIMTVGAGTMDRDFPAQAILGNKNRFTGVSAYSGKRTAKTTTAGLIYDAGSNISSHLCLPGSLDPTRVKGKVVLCDRGTNARVEKGAVVRDAGGVGMILTNTEANGEELVADSHFLSALLVGKRAGDLIRKYVKSSRNPTAALMFGGTVMNVKPAPQVASFSSRGPNTVTPQIIKPDVIGPGVNILAGWTGAVGPTGLKRENRRSAFNLVSGTSMSCPHISGLAALLKAAHPDWSPSAIKSALMTTAYNTDNTRSPLRDTTDGSFSTPLAHGSGHVNPQKALFPGLVYNIAATDYVSFLCSLGYTAEQVKLIMLSPNITCSYKLKDPGQLNYPSFSVVFQNKTVVQYTREVTNVDPQPAVYNVTVNTPSTVAISVKPRTLTFKTKGEKRRYTVMFVSKKAFNPNALPQFGSITWRNAKYQVRSPIAFSWMR